MYNILIVENNLKIIEDIVNNLCCYISSVRICNITSDYIKAQSIIFSQNADIIILGNNFQELSHFIEKNKIMKYKNSIITLPSPDILESKKYKIIINSIQNIITQTDNNDKIIRKKIRTELNYLNFNYSYNGTKYLEDLTFEFYKIKDTYDGNFKNLFYPILATKYNKSIDTIYGNIKHATNAMILDCEEDKLLKYFNYDTFYKPKIKEIVFTIVNKINSIGKVV